MKKRINLSIVALFIATAAIFAQTSGNHLQQIDNAVKDLATELNKKMVDERISNVILGQFVFQNSLTPFGEYWGNQLAVELTNIRNRPYQLLSSSTSDWIISGEIVIIGDIVRTYVRLTKRSDQSIVAAIYSDLARNENISAMLASSGGVVFVPMDIFETDDINNPVPFTIGESERMSPMMRSLHNTLNGDEDFFLLTPRSNGTVIMETTSISGVDTYMYLIDGTTKEILAEDDDSGSNSNARIRHHLRGGKSYIVKVHGYNPESVGEYGFIAYTFQLNTSNAAPYEIGSNVNNARPVPKFIENGSSEMFLLTPNRSGMLVMETTGDTDTYMELYDIETNELLAENDDSEEGGLNARIVYQVQAGKRYIVQVRGFNDDITGYFSFRAYF